MESSQEEIINRILKDAKDEAALILKQAKESAELLLEKQREIACAAAEKRANSILEKAQNEADIIRGKTATDLKRQAGWTVLSEKNRFIRNVMEESKRRLETMKKTVKYVQLLEKLTLDASSVLGGGILIVLLNEKDSELNLNFAKLEKDITTQTGVKTKLCLSEERIATAGVVVKTVDNKVFVDNTFESILRRREKELKPKIAKILFS